MQNSKDEDFVIVTDVQSVERMLTNAEIDYEHEMSTDNLVMLIKANNVQFHFTSEGELEYMGINDL